MLDASVSERMRKTKEKYLVHFRSAKGKQFQREMPEDAWADLNEKDTYILKTTVFGHITRVEANLNPPAEMPEQIIQ